MIEAPPRDVTKRVPNRFSAMIQEAKKSKAREEEFEGWALLYLCSSYLEILAQHHKSGHGNVQKQEECCPL